MLELKESQKELNFVKSPLNYVGGKYKLLEQIIPLFPKKINTFIDLFCGGGNVSANVEAKKIYAYDKEKSVIDLLSNIKLHSTDYLLKELKEIINTYNLDKENVDGYLSLRNFYNEGNKEWKYFYCLLCHSFNYQIRFNNKGEFNMPFGKNRSSFNPSLEKKFVEFSDRLKEIDIEYIERDFRELDIDSLNENDFVYIDPPYLISVAAYNERGGWGEEEEYSLYELCDKLNAKGVKFALSNVTYHKGKQNNILIEWSTKYNVHKLNFNYSNSNYQTKDRDNNSSEEVLITNY